MASRCRLAIVSDIHYASAAEQERGRNYETAAIPNPLLRFAVRNYRRIFWLKDPFDKNYLLDRFIERNPAPDYLIANGDYSCDSRFIGVSDEASYQSARECLSKLRQRYGNRLRVNFGDHELGKVSFFGGNGGMRLSSWRRATEALGLERFWRLTLGQYVLMGVVSSLVALPVFEADTLEEERAEWQRLRAEHLSEIRQAFASIGSGQKVLLFCHDPTALPFLAEEPAVQSKLDQIEQTIIGHLHSNLILWKSKRLAGMPRIRFLGHTAKRLSAALRRAKRWKPFRVRLCPSLAGIELLKDGGYLTVELDLDGRQPAQFQRHRLPR
ncbi:MAG TPA: metallophosphoesterase [Patescibacteria group bacterium]|nr:metallophosphoesterase [Patescibacteria group bacterium]